MNYKSLILPIIGGILIAAVSWCSAFVWDINNTVHELKINQTLLLSPNNTIRPSVDVEILKVKVKQLQNRVDKLEELKINQ